MRITRISYENTIWVYALENSLAQTTALELVELQLPVLMETNRHSKSPFNPNLAPSSVQLVLTLPLRWILHHQINQNLSLLSLQQYTSAAHRPMNRPAANTDKSIYQWR